MPRPGPKRTGSIEPRRRADGTKYYFARVRLADGSRERVIVDEKYNVAAGGMSAEERRELFALAQQEHEDETGELLAKKLARAAKKAAEADEHHGETWDKWFARYLPTKECSEGHRRINGSIAKKWISSVIGPRPMASLTRNDVEDVRDNLDRAIDAKEIRHSTARNTWAVFTGALKAAYAARDRKLRVLSQPLHFGVLPPKRGAKRQRPWLYPSEWSKFATCGAIPVEFRVVCAIALFTGLRPGELRSLLWSDVDLIAHTISVSKAYDTETKSTKAPKTDSGQRVIPIQPHLVPVLEALRRAGGEGVIAFAEFSEGHAASTFRAALQVAKVLRPRLTADNATEEPIDLRSLRDTHATWLALSGVSDKIIQRRMGHASPVTTDRYVKAAETFAIDNVGVPFPALPAELLSIGPQLGQRFRITPTNMRKRAPAVGLEATQHVEITGDSVSSRENESTRAHVSPREPVATGPDESAGSVRTFAQPASVEDALAKAIADASNAGRWEVVAQLARELEARRLDAADVPRIGAKKGGAK